MLITFAYALALFIPSLVTENNAFGEERKKATVSIWLQMWYHNCSRRLRLFTYMLISLYLYDYILLFFLSSTCLLYADDELS